MRAKHGLKIARLGLWLGVRCLLCLLFVPAARAQDPPHYQLDSSWPQELPNRWITGNIHGVAVDKDDHVWILNAPRTVPADQAGAAQTPPRSACCIPAPSIIELDAAGRVLKSWGGPGYLPDWPTDDHGLWVDKDGNVWIAGNWFAQFSFTAGQPPDQTLPWDRQVLKLSGDGKQLLEIGHPTRAPANNQDTSFLGAPNAMTVDDAAHEVYIADGAMNRRLVVYDSMTGAFKRGWGAYGMPLSQIDNGRPPAYNQADPPQKQFRGPINCVAISVDGLVYVCDRGNDRIQVFTKEGKFVKEFVVRAETLGTGSTWSVAFSHDPEQKYLLVGDGENGVVWILDRDDGVVVTTFGRKGHSAGQFDLLQCLAMDSQGNLYTGEVAPNSRVQKWVLTK
jgi:NHL repeat